MGKIDGFMIDETETPDYLNPVEIVCTDCGHTWIESNSPVLPAIRTCSQCGKQLTFFIVEPNTPRQPERGAR
jgi:hypothetical protein